MLISEPSLNGHITAYGLHNFTKYGFKNQKLHFVNNRVHVQQILVGHYSIYMRRHKS